MRDRTFSQINVPMPYIPNPMMTAGLWPKASKVEVTEPSAIAARAAAEDTPSLNETWANPESETLSRIRNSRGAVMNSLYRDRIGQQQDEHDRRPYGPGDPIPRRIDDGIVMHVTASGRQPQTALPKQHQRNNAPQQTRRGILRGSCFPLDKQRQNQAGRKARTASESLKYRHIATGIAPARDQLALAPSGGRQFSHALEQRKSQKQKA